MKSYYKVRIRYISVPDESLLVPDPEALLHEHEPVLEQPANSIVRQKSCVKNSLHKIRYLDI